MNGGYLDTVQIIGLAESDGSTARAHVVAAAAD